MTSLPKETGISMIHIYKEKARGRQNRDQMTKKKSNKVRVYGGHKEYVTVST